MGTEHAGGHRGHGGYEGRGGHGGHGGGRVERRRRGKTGLNGRPVSDRRGEDRDLAGDIAITRVADADSARCPGRPAGREPAADGRNVVCHICYGSGLESYTDSGGDITNRTCTSCDGGGFT